MYELTSDEEKYVDDAWDFLENFKIGYITINELKKKLVQKLTKKYSADDFYRNEIIIEKLYWTLVDKIKDKITDVINFTGDYKTYKYSEYGDLKKELANNSYYKSFTNKIINIDSDKKILYYKNMSGSKSIFENNRTGLLLRIIMMDKNLYERIINNPNDVIHVTVPNDIYYHQLDFGFPNFNITVPFIYDEKYRNKRIQKMYYCDNCLSNWNKLILP